jgi:hypothetical protein
VASQVGGDYYTGNATTPSTGNVQAIVQNNLYYQLFDPNNDASVSFWAELR